MVPTEARVCTACGYIQLHADTEKLKKLKPKPIEDTEPDSGQADITSEDSTG
jgi:hypothetical protein